MMIWIKINAFTGEPYSRRSGAWQVVDHVSGDFRIHPLPFGGWDLKRGEQLLGVFKTLKAAKAYAESL